MPIKIHGAELLYDEFLIEKLMYHNQFFQLHISKMLIFNT